MERKDGQEGLNAERRRAMRAAEVSVFLKQYARKAQRGVEPNDRRYRRAVEKKVKRMHPLLLDALMRDDED